MIGAGRRAFSLPAPRPRVIHWIMALRRTPLLPSLPRYSLSTTRFPLLPLSCLLWLAGACGPNTIGGGVDAGAGDCDPACIDDQVCRYGACVPPPSTCQDNSDCPGDTYCDVSAGECLPWGVGPGGTSDATCTRDVVAGVFFPEVQCEWLGPPPGDSYPDHSNVLGAPVVADFGISGPELGRPSIVFISYNYTDGVNESCRGTNPAYTGVIRVIDGRSCIQTASIDAPLPIASSSLALGDLDLDGVPEIVAATVGGGLAAWHYQGGQGGPAGGFELLWQSDTNFGADTCNWSGPSIHDLDDDGSPEIMMYGAVFDAQGQELTSALGVLNTDLATGYIPVVADVDADGQPELVAGAAIYGWDTGAAAWVMEAPLAPTNGQTAVADFGTYGDNPGDDDRATLDGVAEIVTMGQGTIRVFTVNGRELFSADIPGGGFGGAPTIADFDGDGRAEFATAGGSAYSVFDFDCTGAPEPQTCASLSADGLLWSQPSQDLSSNRTGSSVFDFEGDGRAEAVYGDECFTRVYDGTSGEVVYSRYRTSCTWYENPVIADTDADFAAEIVISSNTNCAVACPDVDPIFDGVRCFDESDCPGTTSCARDAADDEVGFCRCTADEDCGGDGFVCLDQESGPLPMGSVCRSAHPGPSTAMGVRVVGDQLGRWVDTRRIWNQHAYSVTNVLGNGTIPRTSEWLRNWQDPSLNNFRQNAPGDGAGAGLMPDLTIGSASFTCVGTNAEIELEVCNRGTEPVADGVALAVRDGAQEVCAAATQNALYPGFCALVTCVYENAPAQPSTLEATVDNTGADQGIHLECREDNNSLSIPDVACP
jgi:hypothetical protein